jgi:SAM-dependent methyltransferase
MKDPIRGAYSGAARAWARDATLLYVPLARDLVARAPWPLAGCHVLDAGAGTGAVGNVLRAADASVTSVDLEPDMLREGHLDRAVVADVLRLPFADEVFDAAVAAFVLNHVAHPEAALGQLRRVTRSGGVVLASVFAAEHSAAKETIADALRAHGWRPPGWYDDVLRRAAAVETPELLRGHATAAGFDHVDVVETTVDPGLDTPELVARYRLGVAHIAPFMAALSPDRRREVTTDVVAALAAIDEPFRPPVLELVAG